MYQTSGSYTFDVTALSFENDVLGSRSGNVVGYAMVRILGVGVAVGPAGAAGPAQAASATAAAVRTLSVMLRFAGIALSS